MLTEAPAGSDKNSHICHVIRIFVFCFSLQVSRWLEGGFERDECRCLLLDAEPLLVNIYWTGYEKVQFKNVLLVICVKLSQHSVSRWLLLVALNLLWLLLMGILLPPIIVCLFNRKDLILRWLLCFIMLVCNYPHLFLASCYFSSISLFPCHIFFPPSSLILYRGLKVFATRKRCLQAWNRHAVVQQRQGLLQQTTSGWYPVSFLQVWIRWKKKWVWKTTVSDFSLHSPQNVLLQALLCFPSNVL